MKVPTLAERLTEEGYEGVLLADNFDGAFIGIVTRCGQVPIAIYDHDKCVSIPSSTWTST